MSSVWSRHIGHIGGPPVSLAYTIVTCSTGTNITNMCLSLHFIGCVRFAWYHEKMYDCHFFCLRRINPVLVLYYCFIHRSEPGNCERFGRFQVNKCVSRAASIFLRRWLKSLKNLAHGGAPV